MNSSVDLANEMVSITDVCRLMGMDIPDLEYSNAGKMDCPFCLDRAFRVYQGTNTAYCFACARRWGPVSLYADSKDLKWKDAANSLLERFGILRVDPDDRWADLMKPQSVTLNTSDLAESLRLYCSRVDPEWESDQFQEDISRAFSQCLSLLDSIESVDDVQKWRDGTKKYMKMILDKQRNIV